MSKTGRARAALGDQFPAGDDEILDEALAARTDDEGNGRPAHAAELYRKGP